MKVNCEKCQAGFLLDISSIKGNIAQYQCKKCGAVNLTNLNRLTSDEAPTRTSQQEMETTVQSPPDDPMDYNHPKLTGWSIKTKITLIIVLLIIASTSTVSLIASNKGGKALSDQAKNHMRLTTQHKSEEYNAIFKRLTEEIEGVVLFAQHTFTRENITEDLNFKVLLPWDGQGYGSTKDKRFYDNEVLPLQRIGISLQGMVKKNQFVSLGYMATENNLMVTDNEETSYLIEKEIGYIPTKRPWYLLAKSKGKTIWTQPYIDVTSKKLVVTCASPVYSHVNEFIGVVGFDVFLDTIQQDIITLNIGYGSQAFLIDRDGDILAKPGMKNRGQQWDQAVKSENMLNSHNDELQGIVKRMIEGELGLGKYQENNTSILLSYAPISAIDASVGITVSESEVTRPAKNIRQLLFYVWLGVIGISIFVGFFIGNGITRPINNLTMWADKISQGKTELEEIQTDRKDEIGVLIGSFNRLVTSLKIAMARRKR